LSYVRDLQVKEEVREYTQILNNIHLTNKTCDSELLYTLKLRHLEK